MQHFRKYCLGDFELNPSAHSLVRGSTTVPISRKRFQVLLHLIEHRHRVVTRQELVERFWEGHEVYEENLTKCISEVRKALDDQHKPHRFVETLPAVGYRYIGPLQEQVLSAPGPSAPAPVVEAVEIGPRDAAVEDNQEEQQSGNRGDHDGQASAGEILRVAPAPRRGRLRAIVAAGLLVPIALAAFVLYPRIDSPAAADDPAAMRSLAILPFKSISGQRRDEYLELGMADALITRLSSVREVAVMSTGSIRKYANLAQDPIAAGNELKVESVLEGSIQKLDDRIRVTVRLLNVADGSSLWAGTFDENLADIFTLQDAISEKVAGALAVRLSTQERERITKRYTESSEAYQLYQKGRFFWNKRTEAGLKKSIGFFEEAIKIDPRYSLAYAGLADSYLAQIALVPPKEVYPKVKEAALKALEIDDSVAEAHAALAFVTMLFDWNWATAEREFARAFDLNPNDGVARQRHSVSLVGVGRFREAMVEAKRAHQAEPLSLNILANVGWVSYLSRDYDQTIEECNKVIEMDPSFVPAYVYRGMAYEQKGMLDNAMKDLERARTLDPGPALFGALGHAYAAAGHRAKAQALIQELKDLSAKRYFPAYQIALVHIALGEKDAAFALLEQSYHDRYPWLIHLNVEPRLDPIRSDPRFADLVRRMRLGA